MYARELISNESAYIQFIEMCIWNRVYEDTSAMSTFFMIISQTYHHIRVASTIFLTTIFRFRELFVQIQR